MAAGIYLVYFAPVDYCIYIGQTLNIHRRRLEHKTALTRRVHENKNLMFLHKKFGIETYRFFVLERLTPEKEWTTEHLQELEKESILNLMNSGFLILNKGHYEGNFWWIK